MWMAQTKPLGQPNFTEVSISHVAVHSWLSAQLSASVLGQSLENIRL
jgi:hypothetical protein